MLVVASVAEEAVVEVQVAKMVEEPTEATQERAERPAESPDSLEMYVDGHCFVTKLLFT
jgi:hypothetical protein